MIDVQLYIDKLNIVRDSLFNRIDGIPTEPIEKLLYDKQVQYEVMAMNAKVTNGYNSSIIITHHAYERGKERLGINRASFLKLAERAYKDGGNHSDSCGNLRKFIDGVYLQHKNANNIKTYGEYVFLFKFNVLITVYQIPTNLKKAAKKNQHNTNQ